MSGLPRLITLLALTALLLGAPAQPVPLAQAAQINSQPAQVAAASTPSPPLPAVVPAASPPTPASQPAPAVKAGSAHSKLHLASNDKHFDSARSKEIPVADPDARRYDNPDGTHTMLLSGAPQKADGGRSVDLSLTEGPAGDLRPKAAAAAISIATSSGSPIASVEVAPGQSLQLVEPGARSGVSAGRNEDDLGSFARFDKVLAAGTSLEVRPLTSGVETTYVIPTAGAANGLREQLRVPAGFSVRQGAGFIEVVDPAGKVAANWGGGLATDSSSRRAETGVSLQLEKLEGDLATALVVLDTAWLQDRARAYPVRIDPSLIRVNTSCVGCGSSYVDSWDSSSHWLSNELRVGTYNGGGSVNRTLLLFPNPTYVVPAHARIVAATLWLYETWSWSCQARPMEVHRVVNSWGPGVNWGNQPGFTNLDANPNVAAGYNGSCPASWVAMDMSNLVADWYYGRSVTWGVLVKAFDERDNYAWKKFAGTQTGGAAPVLDIAFESYNENIQLDQNGIQVPSPTVNGWQTLTITNQSSEVWLANGPYKVGYHLYDGGGHLINYEGLRTNLPFSIGPGQSESFDAQIQALPEGNYGLMWDMVEDGITWFSAFGVPTVTRWITATQWPPPPTLIGPAMGTHLPTLTPTLSVTDADPHNRSLVYYFRVCDDPSNNAGNCVWSNWIPSSTWTVPAGSLSWGRTYYWRAWAGVPSPISFPSQIWSFTTQQPAPQPNWAYGFDPYAAYEGGVNTAIGNYVYSTTDFAVPGVGPALNVAQTYNSLDLGARTGGRWFGPGWTSTYETTLTFDLYGNADVVYPDGRHEILAPRGDGTFDPAFGFASTMTTVHQGSSTFYDLKHHDQSVWRFRFDGVLDSMRDRQGRQLQLTWSTTSVVIRDQTSGRQFTVSFSAAPAQGGRVNSITTSQVTVGGSARTLSWTYAYDANGELAAACDPLDLPASRSCTTYLNAGPDNRLTSITRPQGNFALKLGYDVTSKRVSWREDGLQHRTSYAYGAPAPGSPPGTVGTTTVTDARSNQSSSSYNSLNQLLAHVDQAGKQRTYTFDQRGFLSTVKDENGLSSSYLNDQAGNVSQFQDGAGDITYYEYTAQNRLATIRDPRSSGATDNTYAVIYTYDAAGNRKTEQTPTATHSWTYTTGTEAAIGGGNMPANLLLTVTDGMAHAVQYSYDSSGNLRRRQDPSGLVTDLSYDELGREISRKETSDTYPAGLISSTGYDLDGRIVTLTRPSVLNTVSNVTHQLRTTSAYDKNGNLAASTLSDVSGGDPSRTTTFAYDANDREHSVQDAQGGSLLENYDEVGNLTRVSDQLGRVTTTTYTTRNQPSLVTLLGFVDDPIGGSQARDLVLAGYAYDDGGRQVQATDALGRARRYQYDAANRLLQVIQSGYHNRDNSSRNVVLEDRTYDRAGHLTQLVEGGLRKTSFAYDASGRLASSTLDPGGLNRTTTLTYDANDNVLSRSLSDGGRRETVGFHYGLDQAPRLDRIAVAVGGGAPDLVTTVTSDQRNLPTGIVEARGNVPAANPAAYTTSFRYDESGRLAATTSPPVMVVEGAQDPAQATRQTVSRGYDTFDDLSHVKDARGQVTAYGYDKLGRQTSAAHPRYTPPSGSPIDTGEAFAYDAVGDLVQQVDRRGKTTSFDYDKRDRLVRQSDPLVGGQGQSGTFRFTYDDASNLTARVDQVGARVEWTYDDLDRTRSQTQVVRVSGQAAQRYVSGFDYDDLGNQTWQQTPRGEVTTRAYNPAGELVQEKDPLQHATTLARDLAGRVVSVTDPAGRSWLAGYDLAGRQTQLQRKSSSGQVLSTAGLAYDAAGNLVSATDPNGHTTTYGYDALSRLLQITEPASGSASLTSKLAYDANGNQTRQTDANGHLVLRSYNAWNLLESLVEPSTAAQPAAANRTWVWSYEAGGSPTKQQEPGSVSVSYSYDELGRLLQKQGQAGAQSTLTGFGWDLGGRLLGTSSGGGSESFAYDDRGLLIQATGAGGASSFSYDGNGQLLARDDASGHAGFGWNARGELASETDPLSGLQLTHQYNASFGELSKTTYGSSGVVSDYGYDGQGRLQSESVHTGASVAYQASYAYDASGNLTQRTLGAGQQGAGSHAYAYDFANRLSSWTKPDSSQVTYQWDGVGNLVRSAGQSYSYDERDRLLSGAGVSYQWSPNGELLSEQSAGGNRSYGYDALGRLASAQVGSSAASYAYDGLDRVVARGGAAFSYAGQSAEPVRDGSFSYSRAASGRGLLGLKGSGAALLAVQDAHGDLEATFNSSGQRVDSLAYTPFGASAGASAGTGAQLGFQGDWTDPLTGRVWMGARWYDPGNGRFLTRDDYSPGLSSGSDTNRYLYGAANPLGRVDPNGHCWIGIGGIGFETGICLGQGSPPEQWQYVPSQSWQSQYPGRWDGGQDMRPPRQLAQPAPAPAEQPAPAPAEQPAGSQATGGSRGWAPRWTPRWGPRRHGSRPVTYHPPPPAHGSWQWDLTKVKPPPLGSPDAGNGSGPPRLYLPDGVQPAASGAPAVGAANQQGSCQGCTLLQGGSGSGAPPPGAFNCTSDLMGALGGPSQEGLCGRLTQAREQVARLGQAALRSVVEHPTEALLACGLIPMVGIPCNLALAGIEASHGDYMAVLFSVLAAGADLVGGSTVIRGAETGVKEATVAGRVGVAEGGGELAATYHRLESPTQTVADAALQESSGEIWGTAGRYDLAPTVRAYRGSLPSGARGVEFTTEVLPNSPYGPIARWSGPRPGVLVEEEFAKIRVLVTRNTQR